MSKAKKQQYEGLDSSHCYAGIEQFIDREIEAMDESGQWSTHAINALLCLQARVDARLRSDGNEIKAELIRMRQYVMRKGLGIGECVAWCRIKERFGIGIRDADDEQWLNDYESRESA